MNLADLLPIVGANLFVGAIQLFIFYRFFRNAQKMLEITAEYLKGITDISIKGISEAAVRVNRFNNGKEAE